VPKEERQRRDRTDDRLHEKAPCSGVEVGQSRGGEEENEEKENGRDSQVTY
jgi:hypothetical protein